jgi:glucosamine--fructose-6-phosphate aminotransferase (isomerizing)
MCGIVGYVGDRSVTPLLIDGLSRLEYRGYDSAGIAVLENGALTESKSVGRLAALEDKLRRRPVNGTRGIGHTR